MRVAPSHTGNFTVNIDSMYFPIRELPEKHPILECSILSRISGLHIWNDLNYLKYHFGNIFINSRWAVYSLEYLTFVLLGKLPQEEQSIDASNTNELVPHQRK